MSIEVNKAKEEKKELITCKYCQEEFTSRNIDSHIYECTKLDVNCPYCSDVLPAENMADHVEMCVQRFSKSYIAMKHNNCCNRLRRTS